MRSELARGTTTGSLILSIQLETHGPFKIYADKTGLFALDDPNLPLGTQWKTELIRRPTPISIMDPVTRAPKDAYKGQSVFELRLTPTAPLPAPLDVKHEVPIEIRFQACSDKICLLPARVQMNVALVERAKTKSSAGLMQQVSGYLNSAVSEGSYGPITFLILLFSGILTAFTPCVYPLYPLTLGIFSKLSKAGHIRPALLAIGYAVGMIFTYALIGLASTASGALFGSLTQTPVFLIGTGLLIIASALVFSGVLDLALFAKIQNRFSSTFNLASERTPFKALSQAVLMGASLGLVASPCVGPVLVVILAWISTKLGSGGAQLFDYALSFSLLATFGLGMSLPFISLAYASLHFHKIPKLGFLAPKAKHAGTFLLLLSSLFFLIPGIRQLLPKSSSEHKLSFKIYSIEQWPKTQPAVIDFRADWCAACLDLERETFSDPKIAHFFKDGKWDFVSVDMTNMDEAHTALATSYGIQGLPTVLISDGAGRICKAHSLFGFEGPVEFRERLLAALENCGP